jgi:Domain of unknown function (DUF1707)
MSAPVTPLRPNGPALRRASWPGSQMRVGDAERSAIADRLAHHFSDGRLDEDEFNDRLDRAMRATTMGDLTGLLADLPEAEPAVPPLQPQPGGRRHQQKMLKMQLERERLRLQHVQKERRRIVRQERFRTLRWLPVLIGAVIIAAIVLHWLTHSIVAWLVIALFAVLWLRGRDRRYRGL